MHLFLKITILLFGGLALLLATLLALISDDERLATPATPVTPEVAQEVKLIAKQMQLALYTSQIHTMTFSEQQIHSLLAVAARALPRMSGDSLITKEGSALRLTLHIPENPFGDYINVEFTLPATSNGWAINQLTIGDLTLSGSTAQSLIESFANIAFGDDEGSKLLANIKQIRSHDKLLIVTYQTTPHLDEKLITALNRLQPWRDESSDSSVAAIRSHYMRLCKSRYKTSVITLGQPLSASLKYAASRSGSDREAVIENRAALLALAIYFGNYRFNTLVNAVPNATIQQCQHYRSAVSLAERQDLALHFIYSMAIKIIADSPMSFAVGELKEMMDSLQGGSGFSFADLAADESGIRFADLATDPKRARILQAAATQLKQEEHFFPPINLLPEGISQQLFEQEYGGTEGDYYKAQLTQIKTRINALPLYQPLP